MSLPIQDILRLQEIDAELSRLEALKGDAPQRLQALREQMQAVEDTAAQLQQQIAEAQSARRAADGNLETAKELKKKYESQLYAVKTNKEYDAITAEIESTEKTIDESETRILELMEQEESQSAELAERKAEVEGLRTEMAERETALNEILNQIRAQVEALETERAALVETLSFDLMRNYERIRNGKDDGAAIASVDRDSCASCHSRIPPQRVVEIREADRVIYCESCGRILLPVEKESEEIIAT